MRRSVAVRLAARLLKAKYELPVPSETNLGGVVESLVCKLAGFPGCRSLKELSAAVLSRELHADPPLSAKDAAKLAPRMLLGVTKAAVDAYRMKVIGGSFEDHVGPSAEQPPPATDLQAFAAAVLDAAPDCPTGWSGDDLVLQPVPEHVSHQVVDGWTLSIGGEDKARDLTAKRRAPGAGVLQ